MNPLQKTYRSWYKKETCLDFPRTLSIQAGTFIFFSTLDLILEQDTASNLRYMKRGQGHCLDASSSLNQVRAMYSDIICRQEMNKSLL